MQRNRVVQLVASLVLVVSLLSAGALATALSAEAGRSQLTYTDVAREGDPPEVALGIAMGAFRGLFVNYLWIRANTLKEEGKFYEAIELSKAITRLQPRFPRVWAFHAWNMAYNISVATDTASERWMWVKAGIELLRDQGIPRNPNDVLIHKELAWIFIHKIQGWTDDANHFYKRRVAEEWQVLLGQPPDRTDVPTPEEMAELYAEWLRPIVEAPETLDGVIADELADLRADLRPGQDEPESMVRELAGRIRGETGLELGFELLRFVARAEARQRSWFAEEGLIEAEGEIGAAIAGLLAEERYGDAWDRLLPHVRRRVLIDEYHMEPARMQRYTLEHGPLDWRHPASHSLYWSSRGVEEGLERQGTTRFNTLNTDRVTIHSIQELFRTGDIEYSLLTDEYFTLPNLAFTDAYGAIFDELVERGGSSQDPGRGYRTYAAGYENFLRDVIRIYYRRGDRLTAEYYHQVLRTADWRNFNDPGVPYELSELTLAEFVEKELQDRISIPHVAVSEIEGALVRAFLEGLLQNKPKVWASEVEYAYRAWNAFRNMQDTRTTADPETQRMLEYAGENFSEIVTRTLSRLLLGDGRFGGAVSGGLGPGQRGELWRKIPEELQLASYDTLQRVLIEQRDALSREQFERIYPAPPGLEEYRERRERQQQQTDRYLRGLLQRQQQ